LVRYGFRLTHPTSELQIKKGGKPKSATPF
jgi:hypothetical protein